MKNIFISYSREDLTIVEDEIIPEIKRINGADCWFDFHEIEAGEFDFPQKIKDGIKECFIFLLILSNNTIKKDWPLMEFEEANNHAINNPLRHVVLVNIDGTEIIGNFASYKDFRDIIYWENHRQHIKLIDNINLWIDRQARTYFEEGLKKEYYDFEKSFDLLKMSAKLGFAAAQSKIAYYYFRGKEGYLQSDLQEATKWCSRATNQGYVGAISLRGSIEKSLGDTSSYIEHHQEAANNGWSYSQYIIGKAYYDKTIKEDIIQALYWLKKAADQNQPDAQFLLGKILAYEFKNQSNKAIEYCNKALKSNEEYALKHPEKKEHSIKKKEEIEKELKKIKSSSCHRK